MEKLDPSFGSLPLQVWKKYLSCSGGIHQCSILIVKAEYIVMKEGSVAGKGDTGIAKTAF